MKNKTLWILSIAFILGIFIYIGIQHRRINRLSDSNQLQAIQLSILNDSVSVYANKNGELTYKLISAEVHNKNLKESLETAGFNLKKFKERDISWRKINSALRLQLAATGSGETKITDTFRIEPAQPNASAGNTDTLYFSKVQDWSNNHLTIFNSKIENSTLFFDYSYKTGISIIQEKKRKETLVSVMLTDPNASITTGNSITITEERKWWQKPWIWCLAGFGAGILAIN
jgi:hypothetical protein